MMLQQCRNITVLCEGESERAYLMALNFFLKKKGILVFLVPRIIESGYLSKVKSVYKKEQKKNPKGKICIWIDWDIYQRNDHENMSQLESVNNRNIFNLIRFSRQNFEDFLIMHLPIKKVLEWKTLCEQHRHFDSPMHEKEYIPLVKQYVFKEYKKGELPIEISEETLSNLIRNNSDETVRFHEDFADWIQQELNLSFD